MVNFKETGRLETAVESERFEVGRDLAPESEIRINDRLPPSKGEHMLPVLDDRTGEDGPPVAIPSAAVVPEVEVLSRCQVTGSFTH